jgi:N-acetylglutamate synthase-like GNAT family acetyltransferase
MFDAEALAISGATQAGLTIESLRDADLDELEAALKQADLPCGDLRQPGRSFFKLAAKGLGVVGYGGLEIYSEVALLRSLVVFPAYRGKGFGRAMADAVITRAAERGIRDVYLLTTSARSFFEEIGFAVIDRKDAPAAILNTEQAAGLCPAAAVLMKRSVHVSSGASRP